MSSQVLGSSSNRDRGFINLESDFRPVSNGVKTDTSLDQNFSQVLSLSFQSVSSDCHGALGLVSLDKFYSFGRAEKVEKQSHQVGVIVETSTHISS